MTSKRGTAGSASERVLSLARRGRKRMTGPSELSGWSISYNIFSMRIVAVCDEGLSLAVWATVCAEARRFEMTR